jgi:hypothetical protein
VGDDGGWVEGLAGPRAVCNTVRQTRAIDNDFARAACRFVVVSNIPRGVFCLFRASWL